MRRRYKKKPVQQKQGNEQFFNPSIQAKLNMGKPGDQYEVEADKMADQVVSKSGKENTVHKKEGEEEVQQKPLASSITPLVQKMEASEDEVAQTKLQRKEDEEPVQMKEDEEVVQSKEEEEPIQAKEDEEVQAKCNDCEKEGVQKKEEDEVQAKSNSQPQQKNSIESKLRNGSGGGKMDVNTRGEMEQGFGSDFGNVNIHTDSEAAQMSQNIGAQAFTHGNDIYFNKGKYNPNSKEGKHLLAHELTHTIQQKGMVQKKVQKKPTYGGARIKHDINLFDSSTAPVGNAMALGHTSFMINAIDLKNLINNKGREAAKNILFPLPKAVKMSGACFFLDSRDINLNTYSIVRILTPGPWEKTLAKEDAAKLLGGAIRGYINNDTPANVKVVIRGKRGDNKLRGDDLKAEMQHANDDRCIFKKYLEKYQNDVKNLDDNFSSGYLGLGSCDARLEEKLNRNQRMNSLIQDYAAFTKHYDGAGGSHFASLSVTKSSDKSILYLDFDFSSLPNVKRKC